MTCVLPTVTCDTRRLSVYRRLADGIVHCAGSATYQIFLGYRSGTRTRSLTLNPNPNPITDPNPNPNPNPEI